jgi:paraquat-inducible protein B
MNSEQSIKKNKGISTIWTLPIIALAICGWLLWSSFQDRGVEITIIFKDASGIVPGKTQVMAKGIPVGLVKKIIPDLKDKTIKTIVEVDQVVNQHLVEDTVFWVVRPELSASSVEGLDTILSGSYIGIQVGSSTVRRETFIGLDSAPPIPSDTPGLHLQLMADALGSIQTGTGIYYRNIQIGTVQQYQLEKNESVLIDIFIQPEFAHLVREGSRFCNASGLKISGKLTNLKLQMESLASLLRGGILLHTPEQLLNSPQVENGRVFTLYPDYESANFGINMTLNLSSGQDIVEGATKVMYRGLEAGFVKEIRINEDNDRTVTALIVLDPRAELILKENTKFWLVKPEISPAGIKNLRLLVTGPYITFQPGTGAFQDHFEILPDPPPLTPLRKGRVYTLTSEQSYNISPHSPVYFKKIPVGEVVDTEIDPVDRRIKTTIFIYQKFLHLLSRRSIFWAGSGLEITAGIDTGVTLSTVPLAQMLYGGISFTTPEAAGQDKGPPEADFTFPLYGSYSSAVNATPQLQPDGRKFRIIATDAHSLSVGAPVLHKNIKIGEILRFDFSQDQQEVILDCFVYGKYQKLIHENSRFFNISGFQLKGSLEEIKLQTGSLQSLLAGGIGFVNPKPGTGGISKSPYRLYDSLEAAEQADHLELTLLLDQPNGLKKGSPIHHKGIEIGRLNNLSFSEDLKTVIGTARIDASMAPLFTTGTVFWVVQAEYSLSGVKNLETLLFGSYLHFLAGPGKPSRSFKVLDQPPRTRIEGQHGLGIILETNHLGSIAVDSPVYYRQVQIGKVTDFELSATFQEVYIHLTIQEKYRTIVRENSKFWNVSGAKVEGGLFSGLSISTESLVSILRGGIALATPDHEKNGRAAAEGFHFVLHDKPEKGWTDWSPNVILLDQEGAQDFLKEIK